jgi:hypothetical protein
MRISSCCSLRFSSCFSASTILYHPHVLNDPSPRRNVLSCSDYSQSSHCIKSQRGGVVFIKDKLAHNKIAMA